jgi:drug/metabolite transporter (DMT)-like permease
MDTTLGTSRLQVLAAALLFSTGGAAVKACTLTGWQVACLRSGIAAVALLVLLPAARRRWSAGTILVGAAFAATMICYAVANKLTTAANTIFLQSTNPLYVLLLSPLLLRESVRRRDLALMASLGFGMALFFVGTREASATAPQPLAGNVVAALSGLFFALTIMGLRWLGRRAGDDHDPTAPALAAGNLLACLIALPFALPIIGSTTSDWMLVSYLGVVQIAVAYIFFTRGVRRINALEAALLLLLEPVLNPVWAWLVHGEEPGGWALAGGAIILGATALNTWVRSREGQSSKLRSARDAVR